ncbi:MAG: 4-hydroxy-3-methylbut-2-enyl diphosphate reductase [Actinomycetota bacterium]|nr:4-hydroxy-3-methylbut-2-enyl diphosphate reductase [Actinomycetota bacterium]
MSEAHLEARPFRQPLTIVNVVERVLVASPRGFCAGVERAVAVVEEALKRRGPPVYVRKQIVHNRHVVADLEARGAIFVESEAEVPAGATVVFSAHGVAPAVYRRAEERALRAIDATCPLVTKVHSEVRHYARDGYRILVIGHAGHEEVDGTMGVAPARTALVESVADAEALVADPSEPLAYVTQTTLSIDDTAAIVDVLARRFPGLVGPRTEDICYATTNRQRAVKSLLSEIGFLLVVGSTNSSNSNRLVEVGEARGIPSALVDDESAIEERWFDGVEVAGLTSGASVPEHLVRQVCGWFAARGAEVVHRPFVAEDVFFRLPAEVRGHA